MPSIQKPTPTLHNQLISRTLLIAVLLLTTPAMTFAVNWNVASGDWSTASNWIGQAPTSSDNAYITNGGTATIAQTGEICSEFHLGAINTGTVEMTGGSLNVSDHSYIGDTGEGWFTHTGGINTISGNLYIGNASSSIGTYNLSDSGQLSAGTEYIGYYSGTGTFTQTGGTNSITNELYLSYDSSSNGTYNLNAGTLIFKSINKGSGTAAFNFGGGTLQANGNSYINTLMKLTGNGGDANIDTTGYAVQIYGELSGTGGLYKCGGGTLQLYASESYIGPTTIHNGTLALTSTGAIGSTTIIDVQGSGIFNVNAKNAGGGYNLSGLQTLTGSGHVIGNLLATPGSHIAPGDSVGVLTIVGNLTLKDGALMDFELGDILASDKIFLPYYLYLNGQDFSDFNFTTLDGFGLGTYKLIDAGMISGSLGGNLSGNIGRYAASLSVSGNDLVLNVVPEPGIWLLLATASIAIFAYHTQWSKFSKV
jgi:autotransporter-associated beta strand protein